MTLLFIKDNNMDRRQQQWGLKSFLILCVCVFCVYEMQDLALENMGHYDHHHPLPKPELSILDIHSLSNEDKSHDVSHINTKDIHQGNGTLKKSTDPQGNNYNPIHFLNTYT